MALHIDNVVIEPGTPFKATGNRATFDVVDDSGVVVITNMEYPGGIGGTPEEAETFLRQVGAINLARDYEDLADLEAEVPVVESVEEPIIDPEPEPEIEG